MALHRLTSITIGVPNVAPTAAYYEEFGLTPSGAGRFATRDGGEQLVLVPLPSHFCITRPGSSMTSMMSAARLPPCLPKTPAATSGGSAGITSDHTFSGT